MAQAYLQDYQQKYPHLFEPMQVGGVRFRNRVIAAPTHHSFAAAPDDRLSERGCGPTVSGPLAAPRL